MRLVPASGARPDRFAELEGAADLVVEIVSDAFVKKTERLAAAYHAAGIPEFWLIDARGAEVRFTIHRREPAAYVLSVTADGRCLSGAFGYGFTLVRSRNASGRFVYDLVVVAGKGSRMKKRRSAGQIVDLLRQPDVEPGKGMNVPDVCRRLGKSQQT